MIDLTSKPTDCVFYKDDESAVGQVTFAKVMTEDEYEGFPTVVGIGMEVDGHTYRIHFAARLLHELNAEALEKGV